MRTSQLYIYNQMNSLLKNLVLIPNLLSLSRVLLTPIIGYYLYLGDNQSTLIAAILMFLAGVSDALDGYAARKLNLVSDFGVAFDPICDKIFAGIVVILLVLFRDFPIWLVALIIGRDLLILIAGMILLRGRKIVVPSNLTGKYTFAAIALLMGSATIRFEYGIMVCTIMTVLFSAASIINYYRVFQKVKQDGIPPMFIDKKIYKLGRFAFNAIFATVFVYQLYLFICIN